MAQRGDIRSDTNREDVREEPARLTRKRGLNTDKFTVPEHLMKDGWSYEWKRKTNMGQEDREHQVLLAENHWRPVQSEDMPGMMPSDYKGAVERGGLMLMTRPGYLTEEAADEVLDISRQRVKTQEMRLGLTNQGELPRTKPAISREYVKPERGDRRTIPE